jgi:hypothetical protein
MSERNDAPHEPSIVEAIVSEGALEESIEAGEYVKGGDNRNKDEDDDELVDAEAIANE